MERNMSEVPGFRFEEKDAKKIVGLLDQCVRLMSESVGYAEENCPKDVVEPFKQRMASICADLGWDVLEQGFYKKHPKLRSFDSVLRDSDQ